MNISYIEVCAGLYRDVSRWLYLPEIRIFPWIRNEDNELVVTCNKLNISLYIMAAYEILRNHQNFY